MFNEAIFCGHLGGDPVLRNTQSGKQVCNFNLASTEKWTDAGGNKQESTTWMPIVVWGKQAENCAKYLAKGRVALVEGRLSVRSYEDNAGNNRMTTEIVADNVKFMPSNKNEAPDVAPNPPPPPVNPEDIPF